MDTAVLTVGTMSGGDAVNITAGEAEMVAVLRSFSDSGRETAIAEVRRICKGIGIAFDCNIEVVLEEGYALQFNDSDMIDLVNKAVTAAGGKTEFIDKPFSGSEDFSFFGKLTGTPSAFMMIAAGRGENHGFAAQRQDRLRRERHQARRDGIVRHRAGVSGAVTSLQCAARSKSAVRAYKETPPAEP